MDYLSQLLGKPILDIDGERIGTLTEAVVTPSQPVPIVVAFHVRTEDGALFLPYSHLETTPDHRGFKLRTLLSAVQPYMPQPSDFSLVRDVLDKQIVDVHDFRVVRVNDIRLVPLHGGKQLGVIGVDTGLRGLMRRLGLEFVLEGINKGFRLKGTSHHFIPWNDVESLPTHNAGEPIKLKVSHKKLATLHPADIGYILNQMTPADRNEVLQSLDVETAADALAEAEEDVQVDALRTMDEERAADILEEMPADEAADVLGDLDKARREELLDHMEDDDREDVEQLLSYGDETAGGLMTNEYVALPEYLTANETIDHLRNLAPDAETIYYIYVIDPDGRLRGVISLRDLIVAQPDTAIKEFMITNVRSVQVEASLQEVAHKFERYKLLALPVVDSDHALVGIITVDDTLERILPENWRKPNAKRFDRDEHDASVRN
jgi:CBS domain-containing protein